MWGGGKIHILTAACFECSEFNQEMIGPYVTSDHQHISLWLGGETLCGGWGGGMI